jgi:hypothetical protein
MKKDRVRLISNENEEAEGNDKEESNHDRRE